MNGEQTATPPGTPPPMPSGANGRFDFISYEGWFFQFMGILEAIHGYTPPFDDAEIRRRYSLGHSPMLAALYVSRLEITHLISIAKEKPHA